MSVGVSARILLGDVMAGLAHLGSRKVQCIVTSPPYWGLRDYGLPPSVWGGDAGHEHEWGDVLPPAKPGPGNAPGEFSTSSLTNPARQNAIHAVANKDANAGQFCACGAWLGCLGLEPTPELYVEHMVTVFHEVRRVLRDDGTLWLNIGDSYAGSGKGGNPDPGSSKQATNAGSQTIGTLYGKTGELARRAAVTNVSRQFSAAHTTIKAKDLVGIPWMLAFALRADGWYLRSEIIWHKPNPMPESVIDRPTKAHETLFLLAKSAKYFYDVDAIKEQGVSAGATKMADGWDTGPGAHGSFHREGREEGRKTDKQRGHGRRHSGFNDRWDAMTREEQGAGMRNKRSVWTIAPKPFKGAHFATFPPALVEPCVLAGSAEGDTVLDPFGGSMTTGVVALQHNRSFVGIELNPDYVKIGYRRIFSEVGVKATIDGVE